MTELGPLRHLLATLGLAAALPALAGNFPTHQGESGLLDIPDAEIMERRTGMVGLEFGYDHAAGTPDHFGPMPVSIGVGLGRFEWAVSARESGHPGDPRPSPMLFGTALKLGIIGASGFRPGLAVDAYLDRFNIGGTGGGRLLLSTAQAGRLRLAGFAGYEKQAGGRTGPVFGLAASGRMASGLELVLEGLRTPRGDLLSAAVRYDVTTRLGVGLVGSYLPERQEYRVAIAFGFHAVATGRAPVAAPAPAAPALVPVEESPALAFAERPQFRLRIRTGDQALPGEARHDQHAPYRQAGPASPGAPPRQVTPSQDDVVTAQLVDQLLQLEARFKRLRTTDDQLTADEANLDAESNKLDERERVLTDRQAQLDARERRLTLPNAPGAALQPDPREAQLEAVERQLATVERGLAPTRDAALGSERDAGAREKADQLEAERLNGQTDAEKSKVRQGELRRQALGARQRMLAGMEARVLARGERLDAVTRQVRAHTERLDTWERRLDLRSTRLDRTEQQFISGSPGPAAPPVAGLPALPLGGAAPIFAMVIKAPTAVFATGAALATGAGAVATRDPARPGLAGDKSVAAATVVAFASPKARLAELDREAIDGVARLAARENCEVLIWARAKDPSLMNEANRRAEEIKALVMGLANLPPRQVVTRITTRPGAQGVDVVISALRESGKARADAADGPARAASLGDGETARRQLRDAVVAVQPAIERCVTDQLVRRGLSRAEGIIKLTVTPAGRVTRATAGNGDLGGVEFETCLEPSIGAWQFPSASGEYLVDVPVTVVGGGAKP